MAKGQQRSNREKKKPKQAKKPAAPASSFASTLAPAGRSRTVEEEVARMFRRGAVI